MPETGTDNDANGELASPLAICKTGKRQVASLQIIFLHRQRDLSRSRCAPKIRHPAVWRSRQGDRRATM